MRNLIVILIALFTGSLQAQSEFLDSNAAAINAFLHEHFDSNNSSMVIGLVDEHGTRVFSAGRLDNVTSKSVDGDTVFEMGSITKVFTSLLLLDAVRRGEMKLDDPVEKYMPEGVTIPTFRGKEITLLNLAVQDSGIPWHPPGHEEFLRPESGEPDLEGFKKAANAYTVEMLYQFLSSHELEQEPGVSFQYSNVGMALLGHAIERASGTDYESLVVDRICRPLGMKDTCFTPSGEQKSRLAHGHLADGTKTDFWSFQAMKPAGGQLTTANDMLKFLSANLGLSETPLTPLMRQTHLVRHSGSQQFGQTAMPWFDNGVYIPPGSNLLGHSGGGAGNLAFVAIDTTNRRGVVVLTNQMNTYPNPVGWTLIQRMPFTPSNTTLAVREVVGLGIGLKKDTPTDRLTITKVFPHSPAGEAGLSIGTEVTQIDDTSVESRDLSACMRLLSGEINTSVRLYVRDDNGVERVLELARRPFLTNG